MARKTDIPRVQTPPSGDGRHVTSRYMTHTGGDDYHGHVRAWNKLHQDMKNVLIKSKKTDTKGNIPGAK